MFNPIYKCHFLGIAIQYFLFPKFYEVQPIYTLNKSRVYHDYEFKTEFDHREIKVLAYFCIDILEYAVLFTLFSFGIFNKF